MRLSRALASLVLVFIVVLALGGCVSAAGKNLRAGNTALAAGAWEAAMGFYEAALRLEPDNEDAKRQLYTAKLTGLARLVPEARALLARGQTLEAVEALARACALGIQNAALEEAAAEAAQVALPAIAAHERQEELERAVPLAEASLRAKLPGYDAASEAARLRSKGAALALTWFDDLARAEQPALARLELERALSFVPGLPEALARVPAADRALRARVTYIAAVGRFDAEPEAEVLAIELSLPMIAQFFPAGGPVEIRGESPEDRSRPGLRLGGVFERYRFDVSRTASSRSCQWVCGKDEVTNPEHTAATSKLARAEGERAAASRAVQPARSERSRADADLRRAERVFASAQRRDEDARARLTRCEAQPRGGQSACGAESSAADRARRERDEAEAAISKVSTRVTDAEAVLRRAEAALGAAEREVAAWRARASSLSPTVFVDRRCTRSFPTTVVEQRAAAGMRIKAVGFNDEVPVLAEEELDLASTQRDETYAAEPRTCPASADPLALPSEREQAWALARDGAALIAQRIEGAQQRYRAALLTAARTESQPDRAAELYLEYLAARLVAVDPHQGEAWSRVAPARRTWVSAFDGFLTATQPARAPSP